MFRELTPDERQVLADRLAIQGVTPQQFAKAQELARTLSGALARACGDVTGRSVTPVEFIEEVLGVEGAGRLVVYALREVAGRRDLYRDV
ncbi:hypothetical protein [Streptomyces sp. NPDC058084]|uniref:hypothetical protein n=1 Tax=Streptomyces sp. NPDC058084 TaxID=3346333 RepID=UPI0036E29BCF